MANGNCGKCGVVLTSDNSYAKSSSCKSCIIEQARVRYENNGGEKEKQNVKNYREKYPEKVRKQHALYHENRAKDDPSYWQRRYHKMSKEAYDTKLSEQDNKCAICKQSFGKPCIDHDHKTGNNRDLICKSCNFVLGHAFDRIDVLENAIIYLKKHGVSDGRKEKES